MTLPGFDSVPADRPGGSFTGAPWKVCLHTTEGGTADGAIGAYRSHGGWPHFTIDCARRRKIQHYPLDVSARALAHPVGTPETNRANVVQFELVGFATETPGWSRADLRWLATEVLAPVRAVCRFALAAPHFVRYPDSYGLGAAQRFSWDQWAGYSGICGHEHAPGNDHGDPGAIDVAVILAALDTPSPAPPLEDEVTVSAPVHDKRGRQWVFCRGTDDRLFAKVANGGWFPVQDVNGDFGKITSGPSAYVHDDGRVLVTARGTDRAVWECVIVPNDPPSAQWFPLGGEAK